MIENFLKFDQNLVEVSHLVEDNEIELNCKDDKPVQGGAGRERKKEIIGKEREGQIEMRRDKKNSNEDVVSISTDLPDQLVVSD